MTRDIPVKKKNITREILVSAINLHGITQKTYTTTLLFLIIKGL